MSSHKHKSYAPIDYPIIVAASNGDVEAIHGVLKHYEGYIAALSSKWLYDEDGERYLFVDETLKRRLETKLITKILCFNAG